MKHASIIALLAALTFSTSALAQDVSVSADVSVSVSGEVSVSTPDLSSALSSVSSELSSAVSSASSELNSSSMSSGMSSSGLEVNCDNLDISAIGLGAVDAMALASVTSVTVFSVSACSGLGDLATLDAGALTAIQADPQVNAALTAQGEMGAEIVGYMLDGTSLTVYVRDRG